MESFILVDDLIECDAEETVENSHAVWTEQALDLFISQLKNATKQTFANQREMLEFVTEKMSQRNFSFSFVQIEFKYNSLKKMYLDKRTKNQEVEPELIKLFGDIKPPPSKRQNNDEQQQSAKKLKNDDNSNSSQLNKSSDEDISYDENDKNKMIWSAESNKFFLDLLEEHRPLLGTKFRTKRQMWEEISRRLKTRGFDLTWSQVENKWKYLVRHYRQRLEMLRKNEKPNNKFLNKDTFPNVYKSLEKATSQPSPTKKIKQENMRISFANDQKLPFDDDDDDDDDGYEDENAFQFEEACSLPEVNVVATEHLDPVNVEDVKPLGDILSTTETSSQLDKISKELSNFRKDTQKYQTEALIIKKQQLEAYKQRTVQFTKIGDALNELLGHMRSRDGLL
ncbi:uncharacterized protein LOC129915561 [Episyrphus balteatus]|uniref:uncharacterized protein LOC129915561 n=1 Tax=Episyrphus balteatus TaxID=286459 RepID=UPI0024859017|nr:uncharacterized protein LOC129915561 [Episyrphus balteatus]